jgi:hypothetical protein
VSHVSLQMAPFFGKLFYLAFERSCSDTLECIDAFVALQDVDRAEGGHLAMDADKFGILPHS